MIVWRLCRPDFATLDGEGAFLFGGRWNSRGSRILYTSAHLSLAIVETLVHTGPRDVPDGLVKLQIEIPESVTIDAKNESTLPRRWRGDPTGRTRAVGDIWVKTAAAAAMRIPSAVVPEEDNVLINPQHEDAQRIRIVSQAPLDLDPRLIHVPA